MAGTITELCHVRVQNEYIFENSKLKTINRMYEFGITQEVVRKIIEMQNKQSISVQPVYREQ